MTNSVINDKVLTTTGPSGRKPDGHSASAANRPGADASTDSRPDRSEIDPASHRLAQLRDSEGVTTRLTPQLARESAARLREDIQGSAATVLRAHRGISPEAFAVAMSPPTT